MLSLLLASAQARRGPTFLRVGMEGAFCRIEPEREIHPRARQALVHKLGVE
ncbi:MAG TPA: hypothetical protein VMI10_13245 [Terriglobales bacterium]|nr:hypothetical protein [Terriglobales bacterium]